MDKIASIIYITMCIYCSFPFPTSLTTFFMSHVSPWFILPFVRCLVPSHCSYSMADCWFAYFSGNNGATQSVEAPLAQPVVESHC